MSCSCASATCSTLHDAFATIPDPRKPRGTNYPLPSILLLCLVGLLEGCLNAHQIYDFGRLRKGMLARIGFHPPKRTRGRKSPRVGVTAPNEDTIGNLLKGVAPEDFNKALAKWLIQMLPAKAHCAIDGKALRGTEEHVLEVFVNELRLVVWQAPVGEKQNELSTLEEQIGTILARFPQLKLLTGDAMFCQKSIAREIHEARRHYFLQLKSPHKTDVEIAQDVMSQSSRRPPLAETSEKRGALMGASLSTTNCGSTA